MTKAGNGPYDRSQNMGPNCGIILDIFWTAVIVCVDCLGDLYHNYSINYVLVSKRPEMGKKFGSKK